jgi:hypothetical protein
MPSERRRRRPWQRQNRPHDPRHNFGLTRARRGPTIRLRAHRAQINSGVVSAQMTSMYLASTAATRLRIVAPTGVAARGRSVPFLT